MKITDEIYSLVFAVFLEPEWLEYADNGMETRLKHMEAQIVLLTEQLSQARNNQSEAINTS